MKHLYLFLLLFVIGCSEFPNNTPTVPITTKVYGTWTVELCFEHEGFKVYRFRDTNDWSDQRHWRYFTNQPGSVSDEWTTQERQSKTRVVEVEHDESTGS